MGSLLHPRVCSCVLLLLTSYNCHGFRSCYSTPSWHSKAQHSTHQQQAATPAAADDAPHDKTDTTTSSSVSFTLPRYFPDEIKEGSYRSPLHTIHVKSVLTDEEVMNCQRLAYDYAKSSGCWNQPDQERHSTYSTCDFPVEDNDELSLYLEEINFHDRIWNNLQELYDLSTTDDLTYLDFFCAHYQANNNNNDNDNNNDQDETVETTSTTMDRLEAHRDGSLLSFTILLNDPSEFEGGGTFFDGLCDTLVDVQDVVSSSSSSSSSLDSTSTSRSILVQPGGIIRPNRAGDATFHSGKILHGANVITEGTRTVLVGFVDVPLYLQRSGMIAQACKDWGRLDVATFRYKRQHAETQQKGGQQKAGWIINNARWIDNGNPLEGEGRSCIRGGYIPAFQSVANRANPEYQRRKRLEIEDRLLRSILLPQGEEEESSPQEGLDLLLDGDITVL